MSRADARSGGGDEVTARTYPQTRAGNRPDVQRCLGGRCPHGSIDSPRTHTAAGRLSDAALHFPLLAGDLPDLASKRQLGRELGLTDELIDQLLAEDD